jgi:Protein of unknown function (DUF1761)
MCYFACDNLTEELPMIGTLNIPAVIVAGVLYFLFGALWYSPLLFAKPFMRFRNATAAELSGPPTDYLITLVNAVIAAFVVAIVIRLAQAATFVDGLGVGLMLAVGLVMTTSLTFTIFSGPHKGLWVIYSGYKLVGFGIMGILLALWR